MQQPPLDPEQLAAAQAFTGPYRVDACAGAGKTTCLAARLNILRRRGISEKDILGLTFTRAAAEQMQRRAGMEKQTLRTLHSWALEVVRREHTQFKPALHPNPLLLQQASVLGPIAKITKGITYKDLQGYISAQKRKGIGPQRAMREAENEKAHDYAEAYAKYESGCRAKGVLDFDSLIIELIKLFESRPDVAARYQIPFLLVDEAQDCSDMDWRLMRLITRKHGNIWAIGDRNQSIFEFRGANPKLFGEFSTMFPGATTLPLSTNYRSVSTIVEYSKEVAPEQTTYIEKLRAYRPGGAPIQFMKFAEETAEAEAILRLVRTSMEVANTAILARTNAQLGLFQGMCAMHNIPYMLMSKENFWKRPEVAGLTAFARYANCPTDDNVRDVIRSPFPITRFLGSAGKDEVIANLEQIQRGRVGNPGLHTLLRDYDSANPQRDMVVRELALHLAALSRAAANKKPQELLKEIVINTGALDYCTEKEAEAASESYAEENLRKVISISGRFDSLKEFVRFVTAAVRPSRKTTRLVLSTVHGFKGLEAKNVFVVGVNMDVFPHHKGELQEEKRLYYVAVSRPTDNLYVSCSGAPSPFIAAKVPKDETGIIDPWANFALQSQQVAV